MRLKDPLTEPHGFEPVENLEIEEIRNLVDGYVKVADLQKLTEVLSVFRDLFFDVESV